MKKVLLSALLLLRSLYALSENQWAVSAIPEELKQNADLVVRLDETQIDISSLTKITVRVHVVYTVFRESARSVSALLVRYDNDSHISDIEGNIYNGSGFRIAGLKSSDIKDYSAVPSGTLYTDDRVKLCVPVASSYPYTVEYFYEITFRNMVAYPDWIVITSFNESVENATLTITAPKGLEPGILPVNFPEPVSPGQTSFMLKNIKALVEEPHGRPVTSLAPHILIRPAGIQIDDGPMEPITWESFGKWVAWLNAGRDELPPETVAKVKMLTNGINDPVDRMKVIYKHFQETTRYIGIQIGIGGFRTAPAEFVAKNGYGDCKALTNYLQSLFKVAGITSYYTLVKSGSNSENIRTDFPSQQFDHAILCVPAEKDTIWIECTDQHQPFGFPGTFTCSRNALMISPEGGRLVRTTVYPAHTNTLNRKLVIVIDSADNASIQSRSLVTGLRTELCSDNVYQNEDEQKKDIRSDIDLPAVNISAVHYSCSGDRANCSISESIDMTIRSFAPVTGNRIFIPLTPFHDKDLLPQMSDRISPVIAGYGYTSTDSLIIRIPEGFKIEGLGDTVSFTSAYGSYSTSFSAERNEILSVRKKMLNGGEYKSVEWKEYSSFINQIIKADRAKAVVVRKS